MSNQGEPIPEPHDMQLREGAAEWIAAGSGVISAAASVGSLGLAWRGQGQALDAPTTSDQNYDPGFRPEGEYDPGLADFLDLTVEGYGTPCDLGVDEDELGGT